MDYEDMEAAVLKGFVRDRQLITIALNQGFSPELLPSPVARRLCNSMIDLYLACVKLGIIFVPINILYQEREIAHILADAEPKCVVAAGASSEPYTGEGPPAARESSHESSRLPVAER